MAARINGVEIASLHSSLAAAHRLNGSVSGAALSSPTTTITIASSSLSALQLPVTPRYLQALIRVA